MNREAAAPSALSGSCLCGEVRFEVSGPLPMLYQCHCSLCRKQGGSVSNTGLIVAAEKFRWLGGESGVATWRRPTGFRSHFCRRCGAPVPNPLRDTGHVWVPAGLIDGDTGLKVGAQLWLSSRMDVDRPRSDGLQFDEAPDLAELVALLHGSGDAGA